MKPVFLKHRQMVVHRRIFCCPNGKNTVVMLAFLGALCYGIEEEILRLWSEHWRIYTEFFGIVLNNGGVFYGIF